MYSNQIAALAEQLAEAKYDMKYADVIVDVDQAYWQIVSIANKKSLPSHIRSCFIRWRKM